MEEIIRKYAALFLIVPEKQDAMDEMRDKIKAIISEYSGNIVKETVIGKKKLAYPIKKKDTSIYYEVIFTSLAESVPKMIRQFRINTDILRTLVDKC